MADPSLANVPEIGGAERIQPSGLQSDTFQGHAAPVMDENGARLAASLGHFNESLNGFAMSQARLDRQNEANAKGMEAFAKQQAIRGLDARISSMTDDEFMNKVKAGVEPWTHDVYLADAIPKHQARILAKQLTERYDADVQTGAIPNGSLSYNPEQEILRRAAPAVEMLKGTAGMDAFREQLDHIRVSAREKHNAAVGKAAQDMMQQTAYDQIKDALDANLQAGNTSKSLIDGVRQVYKDVGPRAEGGSLSLDRPTLDKLVLKAFHEAAKDPDKAAQVMAALDAPRTDEKGNDIPSLGSSHGNDAAAEAIRETGRKTLQGAEKKAAENAYTADALQRFDARDGSFGALRDHYFNGDQTKYGGDIKLDASKTKKEVAAQYIDYVRAANGGQPDWQRELSAFMINGEKHPEVQNDLEQGFSGVGGYNMRSPADATPDQIKTIIKGAETFHKINDTNAAYVGKVVPREQQGFYHSYDILTREMGNTPEQAAAKLAYTYSTKDGQEDDGRIKALQKDTHDKVSAMKLQGSGLFGSNILGSNASNLKDVEDRVNDVAKVISKTTGLDAEHSVDKAIEIVGKGTININGRAIFGTSLQHEDQPHVQTVLQEAFNQNKQVMLDQGIKDPSQLSVVPIADGKSFAIIKADGSDIATIPRHQDDDPTKRIIGKDLMKVNYEDILAVKAKADEIRKARVDADTTQAQHEADEKFRKTHGLGARGKLIESVKSVGNDLGNLDHVAVETGTAAKEIVKRRVSNAAGAVGDAVTGAAKAVGTGLYNAGKYVHDVATDAK